MSKKAVLQAIKQELTSKKQGILKVFINGVLHSTKKIAGNTTYNIKRRVLHGEK